MRNSDEMTIGRTNSTLFAVGTHLIYQISINKQSERKEEVLSFNTLFVRLLWIFMDRKKSGMWIPVHNFVRFNRVKCWIRICKDFTKDNFCSVVRRSITRT